MRRAPAATAAVPKLTNRFSALADSDSETEKPPVKEELPTGEAPPSPTFRSWNTGTDTRWNLESSKKNIFASPFSKQKRTPNRPYRSDPKEGWTSIRTPQTDQEPRESHTPPYPPDSPVAIPETVEEKEDVPLPPLNLPSQEFPSLLTRGKGILLDQTIPASEMSKQDAGETLNAILWAERIKKSLEHAESVRAEKARQPMAMGDDFQRSLGRLSFFRRAMTEEGTKAE
jgi:hypothetical protein